MTSAIRRVAVLGAGTMGAAVAAHAANAGLDVDLLDIAPAELTPEEEEKGLSLESPQVRNRVVRAGYDRMLKARPPALMSPSLAERIRLGNFEDDLERVREADWVFEAIVERLEPKRALLERVEPLLVPDAVVSSNTSGIPLHSIAEGRSEGFRRRFLGTHFFNPPRYLKLLELIPTADTDPEVLERVRLFGETELGKGVVIAKDTPNFIGNRLGSYAGMQAARYAFEHGYSIEEVDELTGPLIGRPKTATFRLNDQVGLDIAVGVATNLYDLAPEDESREELRPPEQLTKMLEAGLLGLKTGAGFYKRTKRDGQTAFDVLDFETLQHRPAREPALPIVAEARAQGDLAARLRHILARAEEDRGARYLRDTLLPAMAYAARRVPEIADSLVDVDRAMEWGYGHEAGPFRTWDMLGVREGVERMESLGIEVAPWVRELLDAGHTAFYREDEGRSDGGRELVYSPVTRRYEPVRQDPRRISLGALREAGAELERNESASLLDLGDGVLCLELHSRNSTLDRAVVELGHGALKALEDPRWVGLVVANEADNFCVGANLYEIAMAAQTGKLDLVAGGVDALQGLHMGFRFGPKPVVIAPHGQTLGGGTELAMHADRVVAAAETYMGLVEVGVGLIPAGGGSKELVRRVVSPAMRAPGAPPLPFLQRAFETIATAKVSGSAHEARELGFLAEHDRVVMNGDHVLWAAKQELLDLANEYEPPVRGKNVYAAGEPGWAALRVGVWQLQWGRYASEYDGELAEHLARVLCGGELSAAQWVAEEYILGLEKEAFLALLGQPKTQERIAAMLKTGKPLRN
jgi:3-hydroxyacyl-CoA dehydrogenase